MKILAIDPGTNKSAYVLFDSEIGLPLDFDWIDNCDILRRIASLTDMRSTSHEQADAMIIEDIESFGMAVGDSVFQTCKWMGQFELRWKMCLQDYHYLKRSEIKLALCNNKRAKDANIRQALINIYGGSRQLAVGTKKDKGPLYGIKSHIWSALAVAVAGCEIYYKCELGAAVCESG